jgi:hypothetical protein
MSRVEGNWRAVVTDNFDLTRSGRVKIDIEPLQLKNMWAEPAIQIGGSDIHGSYAVPRVGDKVFVFFDGGNINHPIYFATSPALKDIPLYFAGFEDPLITARNEGIVTTSKFSEPITNPIVEYPYSAGIKFPNGTLIVVDESFSKTKVGVYHPANSYQEWLDNGDHVGRVATNDYEIIMGDKFIYVGGSIAEVVAQNYEIEMGGNFLEQIGGNSTTEVAGNISTKAGGNSTEQIAGNSTIETVGNVTNRVGGNLTNQVAGNSTEQVGGNKNLTAAMINMTAAMIALRGIVRLGMVGALPVHMMGISFCPYIGAPVTGGSVTVLGSP